ncbi:hypothetical protein B0H63DRAFT_516458 [Podospora didyma]|uniref:Uncharacterized protein n=1 Tax=Podospora didyma TaxID=330526 RepID=A0AAE0P4N7_9PEZI|nr:hypothetical protein B0H63DRAFT_516458 [Podospora didyma]
MAVMHEVALLRAEVSSLRKANEGLRKRRRAKKTHERDNTQVEVLRKAFALHGITFTLQDTERIVNETWAKGIDELGMKNKLRKGTYGALNLYF